MVVQWLVAILELSQEKMHMPQLPGLLYSVPLTPQQVLPTYASTRDSGILTGKSGSVSYRVTAPFFWVLVHTRFYVHSKNLCPQSCGSSVIKSHWPLN